MTSSLGTYSFQNSQNLIFSNSQTEIYSVELEESQLSSSRRAILKVTDSSIGEAQIHERASQLSEHIVKYFHSHTHNKKTHILMENCENGSLYDLINLRVSRVRYLDTKTIKTYLTTVLRAISVLHSNSIVHRDIKPDNLYIDSSSNIKIGDFGSSQRVSQRASVVKGSSLYLPPELSSTQNTKADLYKCDVWSLGKSFFELCSLKTHVEFDDFFNDEKKFSQFLQFELRDVNPNIRSVLTAMLRINPEQRVTAQQALDMILSGKCMEEVYSDESLTTDDDCSFDDLLDSFGDLPVNNLMEI